MIEKITLEQDIGFYESGTTFPNDDSTTFTKINLIWGWNYSGKTTLSRIFQKIGNKNLDTIENLSEWKEKVHVFNSDYVEENIKFDNLNGFISIGNSNINIEQEIKKLQDELGEEPGREPRGEAEGSGLYKKRQQIQDEWNSIKTKRDESDPEEVNKDRDDVHSKIKEGLGLSGNSYNINKFTEDFSFRYYENIRSKGKFDKSKLNILDEVSLGETLKRAIQNPDEIQPINNPDLPEILFINDENIKEILQYLHKSPNVLQRIADLPPSLDSWVHAGIDLHETSDQCYFCGNDITKKRREQLNQHFLEDAKDKLKNKLEELKEKFRVQLRLIDKSTYPNSDKFISLDSETKNTYEQQYQELNKIFTEYNQVITKINEEIANKINNPFQLSKYKIPDNIDSLKRKQYKANKYIEYIKNTISKYNKSIENQDEIKEKAQIRYKNHHIDRVLEQYHDEKEAATSKSIKLQEELEQKKKCLTNTDSEISEKESEIKNKKESLSSYEKTIKNLSEIMNSLGISEELKIATVKNQDKTIFQVQRGEITAESLSEGEKTVIAISYFLAQLEALQSKKELQESIVFIDDPISSFDSNHLYNCCQAISKFFKEKHTCKQLFLTTHNWKFYIQMRSHCMPKGENKNFIIDHKLITIMPKELEKFMGEYQLIFNRVYTYQQQNNNLLESLGGETTVMGNLIRRLAETFLSSYASPQKSIDLLKEWKSEVPILNSTSHIVPQGNPTNPAQMRDAAQFVMEKIKEIAPGHFDAMTDSSLESS